MPFQPRGLIRTPSREALWDETRNADLDLRESKTSEFWEDILHEIFIRNDRGYYVNSQQPPEEGSSKYCDFIVSTKSSENRKVRLIVVEAKRLKVYQSKSQIEALETQLTNYCREAVQNVALENASSVYGMAVVGTRGRLFSVDPYKEPRPMLSEFGDGSGGNADGYRDAEEDIWDRAFELIKSMPPSGGLANPL